MTSCVGALIYYLYTVTVFRYTIRSEIIEITYLKYLIPVFDYVDGILQKYILY